jgi:ferredoxin
MSGEHPSHLAAAPGSPRHRSAPATVECSVRITTTASAAGGPAAGTAGVSFPVTSGARVLHEMIRANLRAIPVGCRGGGCGACRVRVLAGAYTTLRMSRRHVSEDDEHHGYALACRLLPSTDIALECAPASAATADVPPPTT